MSYSPSVDLRFTIYDLQVLSHLPFTIYHLPTNLHLRGSTPPKPMTYYGYGSDEMLTVVSGEHLDLLRAIYGHAAVEDRRRRILEAIERVLRGDVD